ncbi:MAG: T9SS type A sorting domain-containing protein [Saprospiraceae bacterium]|nr:T9SS type A sorting domain-containing protein [Saprospiraceae bacterium]
MKLRLLRLASIALFSLFLRQASAQCEYRIEMFDSFGDGWNGGILTITSGASVMPFSLQGFPFGNGVDSTAYFTVQTGEPLTLNWTPGFFVAEVSFAIYDYSGNLVFQSGLLTPGEIFETTGVCPDCLKPIDVKAENIYADRAKYRWTPVGVGPYVGWYVIYGPAGFVPGPGVGDTLYVTVPKVTINGLQQKTAYDFYLLQDCGAAGFADQAGPYSFETYWANDVGISAITSPQSGCDLGIETISIQMSNYGANPQSLIPFNFSVNGVSGGVPQPQDGFYTGVLGKDSTEQLVFETFFDFSEPGEYLIAAWSEMTGDQQTDNDTFYLYVVNRLIAPYTQDFENWSGGWYVDTLDSNNPSWEFGTPDKPSMPSAASGVNAWVTNLDGAYNSNERSYINSPCFDFSDLTEDPAIEFSLNYFTEFSYDGGFLEMSIDGGQNWDRVGEIGEGFNWYTFFNVNAGLGDVWAGQTPGWIKARHSLTGAAGESEVRLRFGFGADPSVQFIGGMAVDDIRIYVPVADDLAAVSITTTGDALECGLEDDKVLFQFANFGTQPQNFFQVAYSVNDGPAVVENVGATTLNPDEIFTYTFTQPFDSRDQVSNIKAWTLLLDEQNLINDTVTYSVDHRPRAVPFQENFEGMLLPDGWTSNGFITNTHNNISYVLAHNLWVSNPSFTHELPRYGVLGANDTLRFDYRISNFSGAGTVPTTLGLGNKVDVQVSDNCGQTYTTVYTINALNHVPDINLTTIKIGLGNYANESIRIRFVGTWASGDYYFDLDNINLLSCPADFELTADVTNANPNLNNGTATVNVGIGNPPYQYLWSNGQTSQTATNLPVGDASVTVTDALGCSGTLSVSIGVSSTQDLAGLTRIALQPNPTNGWTTLFLDFDTPTEVRLELFDLLGKTVWTSNPQRGSSLVESIDLSNVPAGLYLLRVSANGQAMTRKVVKGG